jgi:hypothetical protein
MSVTDIVGSAQFVIDAEGNKKAVQLDWATWQSLVQLLENLERELEEIDDVRAVQEIEARITKGEEPIRDWAEFEAELDELSA